MSDFLSEMANASLLRAREATRMLPSLESKLASAPPPLALGVSEPGFDVIAEAKLTSPARGPLTVGGSDRVVALAETFTTAGAVAVSVLTEETRFDGAIEHLRRVASSVDAPVLRKDFLVDPVQVIEARAAGASGVLLIVRMLHGSLLEEMTDLILELGMFALVEVFDRSDLDEAARIFDRDVLVGVNCRDLTSLDVDFDQFSRLAPHLPPGVTAVAESGITGPSAVAAVAELGYRLALVGSYLVEEEDPGRRLGELIEGGRSRLSEVRR